MCIEINDPDARSRQKVPNAYQNLEVRKVLTRSCVLRLMILIRIKHYAHQNKLVIEVITRSCVLK